MSCDTTTRGPEASDERPGGELAALRWDDLHLDKPLDDGAIAGPGRLRVVRTLSDPSRCGRDRRLKGPKTEAGRRTIALDQETCDTLRHHRERFADGHPGLVFTTPWWPARQRWAAGGQQLWPHLAARAQGGRFGWRVAGAQGCAFMICATRTRPGCWRCGCR